MIGVPGLASKTVQPNGLAAFTRVPHRQAHRPPGLRLGVSVVRDETADRNSRPNVIFARRSAISPGTRSGPSYYSGTVSPDPPKSAGKSFILGNPSFIGSTVSA